MRLIDIENIDYVRLEDSLHCLEHHKGDEVECVICAPTVEAIPKADYEQRLKADMVAMLEDLDLKIDEIYEPQFSKEGMDGFYWAQGLFKALVQEEIKALKEGTE